MRLAKAHESVSPPASQKQDKALFRFRELYHFALDAVLRRSLCGLRARIRLIHEGNLHLLTGHFLNLGHEFLDLGAVLLTGRRHS